MKNLWDREPAMILGLVQTGIALSVTFGLHLSAEQIGAIMAFSASILALWTRSKVTPNGDQ